MALLGQSEPMVPLELPDPKDRKDPRALKVNLDLDSHSKAQLPLLKIFLIQQMRAMRTLSRPPTLCGSTAEPSGITLV